jgi:hypothetical protein
MNELIEKWKLNKTLLAVKMDMPLGTFCNKLNPKHSTEFNDAEIIKLKFILMDLGEDISSVSDINFNEALKVIVK